MSHPHCDESACATKQVRLFITGMGPFPVLGLSRVFAFFADQQSIEILDASCGQHREPRITPYGGRGASVPLVGYKIRKRAWRTDGPGWEGLGPIG